MTNVPYRVQDFHNYKLPELNPYNDAIAWAENMASEGEQDYKVVYVKGIETMHVLPVDSTMLSELPASYRTTRHLRKVTQDDS